MTHRLLEPERTLAECEIAVLDAKRIEEMSRPAPMDDVVGIATTLADGGEHCIAVLSMGRAFELRGASWKEIRSIPGTFAGAWQEAKDAVANAESALRRAQAHASGEPYCDWEEECALCDARRDALRCPSLNEAGARCEAARGHSGDHEQWTSPKGSRTWDNPELVSA